MPYFLGWLCYLVLPLIPIDSSFWRWAIPKASFYAYHPSR